MLPPKALPSLARFWQHLNSGMNRAFNWKQASPRIIQRLLLEQLLLLLLPPPLLPLPLLMCLLNQHLHASWTNLLPNEEAARWAPSLCRDAEARLCSGRSRWCHMDGSIHNRE